MSNELPDNDARKRENENQKEKQLSQSERCTKAPSLKKFATTWLHSSLTPSMRFRSCLFRKLKFARANESWTLTESFLNDKVIKTKSVKGDDPPNVLRFEIICIYAMAKIAISLIWIETAFFHFWRLIQFPWPSVEVFSWHSSKPWYTTHETIPRSLN